MSLIKSISGIRGTIGGKVGEGLNPLDIVKFTAAYATVIRRTTKNPSNKIVVGRDARLSGEMLYQCVSGTLIGMGFDVVNIGLATTPTTEIAVTAEKADGGIILTASHNPIQWNALKLLNSDGEFFDKATVVNRCSRLPRLRISTSRPSLPRPTQARSRRPSRHPTTKAILSATSS